MINALRMRPDRIIVGEVRGEEALDMLQAMNTGHDGSLTTIHANSPRDALYRLDTMIAMANLNIPDKAVRQQVASAVNLVIQVTRLSDGTRRVTSISEITGMEQDVITMQEIFAFQQTGINKDGKVVGTLPRDRHPAEVRRQDCAAGMPLPMDMFSHVHPVNEAAGRAEVLMTFVVLTFVVIAGLVILASYWLFVVRPEEQAQEVHLAPAEVGRPAAKVATELLKRAQQLSTVPAFDAVSTAVGRSVATRGALLEQSGSAHERRDVSARLGDVRAVLRCRRVSGDRRCSLASSPIGALAAFGPDVVLRSSATNRVLKFEEQFPEALALISRALKAGHTFTTGLAMVAEEMPAPIGPEFKLLFDQQNYGMPLPDALERVRATGPAARCALLRHGRDDPARVGRQPVGNSRQHRDGHSRSLSRQAPDPRHLGARAHDGLGARSVCRRRWRSCCS